MYVLMYEIDRKMRQYMRLKDAVGTSCTLHLRSASEVKHCQPVTTLSVRTERGCGAEFAGF